MTELTEEFQNAGQKISASFQAHMNDPCFVKWLERELREFELAQHGQTHIVNRYVGYTVATREMIQPLKDENEKLRSDLDEAMAAIGELKIAMDRMREAWIKREQSLKNQSGG